MRLIISTAFLLGCLNVFGISFTYSSGPNLNSKRHFHQSQRLNDGRIIVFGGYDGYVGDPTYYKSSEIFDPNTNQWTPGPDMSVERHNHTSVLMSDGKVLTLGGAYFNYSGEIYNPSLNSWTTIEGPNEIQGVSGLISLKDGRILAVGYSNEETYISEFYFPSVNKWMKGPTLNAIHGGGITLTLLSNDNVALIGGAMAQKSIEIFNPITNTWNELTLETAHNRSNHSAVELKNGNILVTGGSDLNEAKFSEILDLNNETLIESGNEMAVSTNYSPMVLLDNGNPLIYGIGEIVSTNQKSFQEYNTSTNTWEHSNNVGVGVNGYTIHRLDDGRFIIIGGNWTSGNGASEKTIFINQDPGNSCIEPLLYHTISSTTDCYGKDASVNLSYSEWGLEYSLWRGDNKISNDYTGTAYILNIPIDENLASSGSNKLRVGVKKNGCPLLFMDSEIELDLPITNSSTPTIEVVSGDTVTCSNDSVLIGAVSPTQNIVWINGETGNTTYIKGFTGIYAQYELNGCLSAPSNSLYTRSVISDDIDISNNPYEICRSDTLSLNAYPSAGSWSGTGIINGNQFKAPGSSSFRTVYYNYCGIQKSLQIKLQNLNEINFDTLNDLTIYPDPSIELCGGRGREIEFDNVDEDETYSVFWNDELIYSEKGDGYYSRDATVPNDSTGTITILIESDRPSSRSLCPVDSVIKTFVSPALNRPKDDYQIIYPDTFCLNQEAKIHILNPDTNAHFKSSYAKFESINEDTLTYYLDIRYTNNNFEIKVTNNNQCASYIKLVDDKIIGKYLNLQMDVPVSNSPGDTIRIINNSTASNYEWDFNGNTYTSKNIDTVINELGKHDIRLIGDINNQCTDTIYTRIHTIEDGNKSTAQTCYWDTLQPTNTSLDLQDIHVDNNRNKYVYTTEYGSGNGADYSGSYVWSLSKFNSNWELQWTNSMKDQALQYQSWFHHALINDLTTDDEGNIYLTGSFKSRWINIGNTEIVQGTNSYSTPFIAKMQANGEFEWFYYHAAENPQNVGSSPRGGTSIIVKNGEVYCFVSGLADLTDLDGNIITVPGVSYEYGVAGIIKLSTQGQYIDSYILHNSHSSISQYKTPGTGINYNKSHVMAPIIELVENNQLVVLGKAQQYGPTILGNSLNNGEFFTAKLDLTTGQWDNNIGIYYGGGTNFRNDILSSTNGKDKVFSCHIINYGHYSLDGYEFSNGEIIDLTKTDYINTGTVVTSTNLDGDINWKKEIIGFEASSIDYSTSEKFIVVVGIYNDGLIVENNGFESVTNKNIAILVFDKDGNLITTDNITTNTGNLLAGQAHLTDCGDLIFLAENSLISTAYFRGDSLELDYNQTFIFDFPLGSEICNNQCDFVTKNESVKNQEKIMLFPNPATNKIYFDKNLSLMEPIQIFDFSGKLIKNIRPSSNEINISDLSPGLYFINITNQEGANNYMKFEKIK